MNVRAQIALAIVFLVIGTAVAIAIPNVILARGWYTYGSAARPPHVVSVDHRIALRALAAGLGAAAALALALHAWRTSTRSRV